VLDRFAGKLAPAGFRREAFYPCYGLAESTLMVTGTDKLQAPRVVGVERAALGAGRVVPSERADAQRLVGCGRPADEHRVIIVDPERRVPVEAGRTGEIWVSGPSVCAGYWNDGAATAETFGATLRGSSGCFLRTGDLGFLADGQLFVVGRSKDLIIVRGCNHYPEDIERTIECVHPGLRAGGGVVFGVEIAGEERVVAVHEIARGSGGALAARIAADVTEAVAQHHGLRLHASLLVKPGSIPKTSSGKLRRTACRSLYLEGKLQELDA
jgi:acyl-CoA synthetase (AMP-forming)/AMP-acid ligase II